MKRHLPFLLHSNGVIRFILRVHLSDELSLQSLRRLMFHLWNTQNRNLLKECVFSTVFFFLQLYFISLSSSCRLNQGRTKRVSSENQKWQLWLPGRTGCRGHSPCLAEWAISQLPADETPLCRFSSLAIDYTELILFCFWSNAKAIHLATRKQRR